MERSMTVIISVALCVLSIGCVGRLSVQDTIAVPSQISAGDPITAYVVLQGPVNKIASVSSTVREDPSMQFRFNNDGIRGDKAAGDHIWSHQTRIPLDAPAGTYHLDVVVRDKAGNIITPGDSAAETSYSDHSDTIVVQVN